VSRLEAFLTKAEVEGLKTLEWVEPSDANNADAGSPARKPRRNASPSAGSPRGNHHGPEVGIQEFIRKNLVGILREFERLLHEFLILGTRNSES
jgi:hypothetical protein